MGCTQRAFRWTSLCVSIFFSHEIFFFALPFASRTEPNSELCCFKKKDKALVVGHADELARASAQLRVTPVPGTGLAPSRCQPASAPVASASIAFSQTQRRACQVVALVRMLARSATKRPRGERRKAAALLCPPAPQHPNLSQPWVILLSLQHPTQSQHESSWEYDFPFRCSETGTLSCLLQVLAPSLRPEPQTLFLCSGADLALLQARVPAPLHPL